ncbi:hypothetical protein [Candidatus Nitrospira nitrificans]|uniref:Uncharacterized protein n=1 Tax=Candidatus Nitrospira nitrificans TaxID=1742973 RepID=A0A0S4LND7_9BACT|nr:hypothetical protein [Candidatus Nitrospira nitrificans]CUS37524.1 hypothetical protein COMA2_30315 [Candidatus Nitrospira nitrificans]
MSNAGRIIELKQELAVAEADARPVIVEVTHASREKIVYKNKTTGTVRIDLKDGKETQKCLEPVAPVAEGVIVKAFDPELGEVMSENAKERVIKLASGTMRTDNKAGDVSGP